MKKLVKNPKPDQILLVQDYQTGETFLAKFISLEKSYVKNRPLYNVEVLDVIKEAALYHPGHEIEIGSTYTIEPEMVSKASTVTYTKLLLSSLKAV